MVRTVFDLAVYLLLVGACSSCAGIGASTRSELVPTDRATECSGCRTERLLVSYNHHYGYSFYTDENLITPTPAEFGSEEVRRQFDRFFSSENLARHEGRRVYCDCVGERLRLDSRDVFRVVEARFLSL